jgi:putative ABC transport system substrate-binding protein
MKRREFISLLGGAAAVASVSWSLPLRAQRAGAMPKVAVLMTVAESDPEGEARNAAFRQGLADLGWRDGQNVHIEYRWGASTIELIRQYARELVALAPDVILANGTPVVAELKTVTSSIPIVCVLVIDPVGLGLVQSLAHPGGNITGFTFINPELVGKWMGLLKDMTPGITRAALLFNPSTTPIYYNFLRELEAARPPGAIELMAMPVATPGELATAIAALAQRSGSSLMVGPDPFNIVRIKEIAQLAAQNRLPAISVYRQFAVEGGLMGYGPETPDIFRRSAAYVDRILKGASPAELPVQQPTKFEFVVNLKSAQALGLTVPLTLQAIADEVIE